MTSSATDAEVIAASLNAPWEFAPIFERHFDRIFCYLSQRTDQSTAEDLTSDVFAIALKKRDTFVACHTSALPWLYGIASRLLADQARKRARQARAYRKAASQAPVDVSPFSGSHDRVDAQSVVSVLKPAIESLSARDKDLLHLYAYADLTYTQIASALGIPVGTVRSRLHRIRRSLHKAASTDRSAGNE